MSEQSAHSKKLQVYPDLATIEKEPFDSYHQELPWQCTAVWHAPHRGVIHCPPSFEVACQEVSVEQMWSHRY